MLKLKKKWFSFWINVAFLLRLRWPAVKWQRWLKKEHKAKRSKLITAETPEDIRQYALDNKYKWRPDQVRVAGKFLPLDWVTDPEVFQARLEDEVPKDGDCDDYHFWFASVLETLDSVDEVIMASVGYPGGGHTVCGFLRHGKKYLVNYKIQEIDNFDDIPQIIAEWGTDAPKEPAVLWYVFESMEKKWTAMAVGPKKLNA
jgi:hypothetical protein